MQDSCVAIIPQVGWAWEILEYLIWPAAGGEVRLFDMKISLASNILRVITY